MKTIYIACLCFIFAGCKNTVDHSSDLAEKEINQSTDSISEITKDGYWKITGTEPFWSIYIHKDTILFTKLNENIDSVYFKQEQFKVVEPESDYVLTDAEKNNARLLIKQEACSDGMSDHTYPYSATFNYKGMELKGCAEKK